MKTPPAPELATLGETMVALVPATTGPLRYVQQFLTRIAGAESNLAIGMAKLGHPATWISRLGKDEFGQLVLNGIRAEGVDVSNVTIDPEHRTGLMVKEMSAGETSVYYYRENSAASHLGPDDLDREMFTGCKIVHLTGITPVLSDSCRAAVLKALDLAEAVGARISFDPNVRQKLWRGRDMAPLLRDIALRADILLLGLDEAETLFGTAVPEDIFDLLISDGIATAVAIKNGAEGSWVADPGCRRHVEPIACTCIEPIGAGDAFNAGFLSGLLEGADIEVCGRMGNIAGGLATQVPGDVEGYPSREKIQAMLTSAREVYR
ncbi:MAG: sugar kinase [Planctomycetes bacterium]|nr:sugar kinase [Planctomycetota bacterium]